MRSAVAHLTGHMSLYTMVDPIPPYGQYSRTKRFNYPDSLEKQNPIRYLFAVYPEGI